MKHVTAGVTPARHENDLITERGRENYEFMKVAPGSITTAEMQAANAWAKANPRRGVDPEGARDWLRAEYERAGHHVEQTCLYILWDVAHERLFGLGRALNALT